MNLKIAAMILILFAGLTGSYFILKNSAPNVEADQSLTDAKKTIDKISAQNPIQWLKDLNPDIYSGLENLTDVKKINNQALASQQTVNLTEFVAKSMFGQMKEMDQGSDNPFEGFDSNNPESQKLIEEALAGLQDPQLIFSVLVDDKDIKISQDNSREAKKDYLKEIELISQNRFRDPKYQRTAKQITKDIESDCFLTGNSSLNQELNTLYQNLAKDYLNLIIPSDWSDIHKQIIIHFKNASLIYQALADCSKDPIKGYLAAQTLPQLSEKAQEVQDLLSEKSKAIGL
ncbi:MAG: hypothetical protein AAB596_00145 [Patescibacteria group bacterium]